MIPPARPAHTHAARRLGDDTAERAGRHLDARVARARLPQLALAALLGAGAAVGACALPSEYPVDLGRSIEISVDADRMSELDAEALARYVERELGAERVEVHMMRAVDERQVPDGQVFVQERVHLRLFALGGDVNTEEGWEELLEEFPILAEAEVEEVPLEGTVHGTIGGRLSRQFLDFTIDEHGVEEAERRILEQLRAGGIDTSNAKVDVFHWKGDDGHEEIRVRVEAESEESPPSRQ